MNKPIGYITDVVMQAFKGQHRDWTMDDVAPSSYTEHIRATRQKLSGLLGIQRYAGVLNSRVTKRLQGDGYTVEEVVFDGALGMTIRGLFMRPDGPGPYPVIIALHDHGGFYSLGAEKMIDLPDNPPALIAHQKSCYGGRPFGNAAVKRGYAVMAIDAFCFGSRRPSPDMKKDDEGIITKHLLSAGLTWAGLAVGDDMRTVDYLLTREDVDPSRICCAGMSYGGFRSAFLAGMDARIHSAAVTCWMTSFAGLMPEKLGRHTFMAHTPGLTRHMDLPDIAAMALPKPLLIQYGARDDLFTTDGMTEADKRIQQAYLKADAVESLKQTWYDRGHLFDAEMQDEVLDWFDNR